MATYSEKLWGSSSGTFPTSILTKRWTTTNETVNACVSDTTDGGPEGGYLLEAEWSVAARRLNSWDTVEDSNHANIELVVRFRLEGTSRADNEFGIMLRASGSGGSENGYFFAIEETSTNDIGINLAEFSSGTFTELVTVSTKLYDVGEEWLWMRCRANSTTLQARLWRDGDVEDTTWDIDTTDSTHSAAGWNGFYNSAANLRYDVDYAGGGTNGDTAPITAGTTNLRLTNVNAQVMATEGDPVTRLTTVNAQVMATKGDPVTRLTTVNKQVMYSLAPPSNFTQQVAELAVQQNLANVEVRSTQQIVEMLVYEPKIPSLTQQVAEAAVQQNAANVEVRSTQQVAEVLYKTGALNVYLTKQTAEIAVQNPTSAGNFIRSTQQIIEILMAPPDPTPAYDNFDAQPISVMV